MRRFRNGRLLMATLGLSLTLACVTINIYFPAEKVESVAGKIVDEIRGPEKKGTPKPDQNSSLLRWLATLAVGQAWAEEITTVENATIRELKARMKARYQQTRPYYRKGVFQEGDDGYVHLGSGKDLSLKEKRLLKGLMAAENRDRKALYEEVARALQIDPSQVGRVAEIFAKEWKKTLP